MLDRLMAAAAARLSALGLRSADMKTLMVGTSLAVGALLASSSATQAKVLTVSAVGQVRSGTDSAGLFGPAGTDLANSPFSMSISIDLGAVPLTVGPGYQFYGGGQAFFGGRPSIGSGSLTINGTTISVDGSGQSWTLLSDCSGYGGGWTCTLQEVASYTAGRDLELAQFPYNSHAPTALDQVQPGNVCNIVGTCEANANLSGMYLPLNVTSESMSVTPEPGAWVLTILGFGGLGLAARRRRRLSRPALA